MDRDTDYHFTILQLCSVQSLSRIWPFATPWTIAHQAFLSITNSWSLLKLVSIELVMPSNHLIFCRSLLLSPTIFLSIRVFSNESVLHIKWPTIGVSALASVLPMNIQNWFLRIDWLDLLAVQGTFKSLLQPRSLQQYFLFCLFPYLFLIIWVLFLQA